MKGSELVPISDYYKNNIIDMITITRSSTWWSAVLLIKTPDDEKKFISIYRWQKVNGTWKIRKNYRFNNVKEIKTIINALHEFAEQIKD